MKKKNNTPCRVDVRRMDEDDEDYDDEEYWEDRHEDQTSFVEITVLSLKGISFVPASSEPQPTTPERENAPISSSLNLPRFAATVSFSGSASTMHIASSILCPETGQLVVESDPIKLEKRLYASTTEGTSSSTSIASAHTMNESSRCVKAVWRDDKRWKATGSIPPPHLTVQLPKWDPQYKKVPLRRTNRDSHIFKEKDDADTSSTSTDLTSSTSDNHRRRRGYLSALSRDYDDIEQVAAAAVANAISSSTPATFPTAAMTLPSSLSSHSHVSQHESPESPPVPQRTSSVGSAASLPRSASALWSNSGGAMPEIIELSIRFKCLDHILPRRKRSQSQPGEEDPLQDAGEKARVPRDQLDGVAFLVVFGHEEDRGTIVMDLPIRQPESCQNLCSRTNGEGPSLNLNKNARLRVKVRVCSESKRRMASNGPMGSLPAEAREVTCDRTSSTSSTSELSEGKPSQDNNPNSYSHSNNNNSQRKSLHQDDENPEELDFTRSMIDDRIAPLMQKIIENEKMAMNHRLAQRRAMDVHVPNTPDGTHQGSSFFCGGGEWSWSRIYNAVTAAMMQCDAPATTVGVTTSISQCGGGGAGGGGGHFPFVTPARSGSTLDSTIATRESWDL